jgi:hypothetical protein
MQMDIRLCLWTDVQVQIKLQVWVEEDQAGTNMEILFHRWWQLAWLASFLHLVLDITTRKEVLARTDLLGVAMALLQVTWEVGATLVLLQEATTVLVEVDMVPEVATARHQEATMAQEEASVVALRLQDGMVEAVVVTVQVDRDLEDHHHPIMQQTLTTDLRVAWHPLSDNDHLKINLLPEALRLAIALVLAKRSRWTSVPAAHLVRYLIKFRLMVWETAMAMLQAWWICNKISQ